MAEPLQHRRPTVGMALYGDITYDSRVRKEARSLSLAGYAVTIVCLAGQETATDLPADVRILVRRPVGSAVIPGVDNPYVAATGGRLRTALRRVTWIVAYVRGLRSWGRVAVAACGPVDIWHAHDLTGLAAIAPSLPPTVPIVYDSHELFLEAGTASRLPGPVRRMLRAYERRLIRRVAAVITVNRDIADVLTRRYAPRQIGVVHNCPDRWTAPAEPGSLLREAAGIPTGVPIVLYHGALTSGRGIERLMDALLQPALAGTHLVLMGLGDQREEIVRRAEAAPWRGRIHVIAPVAPADLLPWVASADIGAMPNPGRTANDRFSSPNKLFECLAAGTPVVASDFPTMRRLLLDDPLGPLGAVCDPGQVESIGAALASLIDVGPAARAEMRLRCARAAADRWNWQAEAVTLVDIYGQIAATLT